MIKAKFDAKQDADRLRSVARGLSYNAESEAVWKHVILEIAMRLETGGYCEIEKPEPVSVCRSVIDAMRAVMIQINHRLRQYQRAIEKHHMIK